MQRLSLLTLALTLGPGLAAAQGPDAGVTLTYGGGIAATSGLYVGQEDERLPFPILTASYGNWTADLTRGLRYAALSTESSRVEVGLAYRLGPDLPDIALFDGLDRGGHPELVAAVEHQFEGLDIAAEFGADLWSPHGGLRADLSVGQSVAVGLFEVKGRLGAEYLDADAAAHLYGVRPDEATSLRAAYQPGALWTPRIELSASLPVGSGAELVGFLEYRALPDAVADSPLVADRTETTFGLSLTRSF